MNSEEVTEQRKEKFLNIGKQKSFKTFANQYNWVKADNFIQTIKNIFYKFKKEILIMFLLIFLIFLFL